MHNDDYTYPVKIDKNEKMEFEIVAEDSVTVTITGKPGYKKEHGYTHMSYKGVCDLIDTLKEIKRAMEEFEYK